MHTYKNILNVKTEVLPLAGGPDDAGRWYRPGQSMIGVGEVFSSEKPDPLSVDVVSVLSADQADEVSRVHLKMRPSSPQSCVGFSAGGGACGKRIRRARVPSMVGVPAPPWASALPVKGGGHF